MAWLQFFDALEKTFFLALYLAIGEVVEQCLAIGNRLVARYFQERLDFRGKAKVRFVV